jgi:hypothetical protein
VKSNPLAMAKLAQTNAAQASHPGRIARGCPACTFTAHGDEVYAHKTAFRSEYPSLDVPAIHQ